MFGWDWPTLTLERLVDDWRSLGYTEEVYEKVFHRNAENFLSRRGSKVTASYGRYRNVDGQASRDCGRRACEAAGAFAPRVCDVFRALRGAA